MPSSDARSLPHGIHHEALSAPADPGSSRIASVDIFRGLTILVMIFVNELAGVRGLSWWTYHLPEEVNGMTYVDMVFPFFLFIVGISVPLAIRHRISRGDSAIQLWMHIIARSFALIALGMVLANAEKVNAQLTQVSARAWALITLNAASLARWIRFPDRLPFYEWPWNNGCFCLMTMAGIVVSSIFLSDAFAAAFVRKAALALGFAAILFAGGWLLTPLGISKIRATPT